MYDVRFNSRINITLKIVVGVKWLLVDLRIRGS